MSNCARHPTLLLTAKLLAQLSMALQVLLRMQTLLKRFN
jgi:hypothetical protein